MDCVVLFDGADAGELCICVPKFCWGNPGAVVSDREEWWRKEWLGGRRLGAAVRHH